MTTNLREGDEILVTEPRIENNSDHEGERLLADLGKINPNP